MTLPNPWTVYGFDVTSIQKDITSLDAIKSFNYITKPLEKARLPDNVDAEKYRQNIPYMAIAIMKNCGQPIGSTTSYDGCIGYLPYLAGIGDATWMMYNNGKGPSWNLPDPWTVYGFDLTSIQKDINSQELVKSFNYITSKLLIFASNLPNNVDPEKYNQNMLNMTLAIISAKKDPKKSTITLDELIANLNWIMATGNALWKFNVSTQNALPRPWQDLVPFDCWTIQKPEEVVNINSNYSQVGTVGECNSAAYYISQAWSPDIIDKDDPKTTAAEFGDNRYNTWVNRATNICTNDPQCNAVTVWRDGGYRKYEACDSANADESYKSFTKSFKNNIKKPPKTLADPPTGDNVYQRIKISGTADNVNFCAGDKNRGSLLINSDDRSDLCKWNYDPVTQQLKNKASQLCVNINMDGNSNDLIQWTCDPNLMSNKFKHNKDTQMYESVKNPGQFINNTGWQPTSLMKVFASVPNNSANKWDTVIYDDGTYPDHPSSVACAGGYVKCPDRLQNGTAIMQNQNDGSIVTWCNGAVVWNSGTSNIGSRQDIYLHQNELSLSGYKWASGRAASYFGSSSTVYLYLEPDGHLIIYVGNIGGPDKIWSTRDWAPPTYHFSGAGLRTTPSKWFRMLLYDNPFTNSCLGIIPGETAVRTISGSQPMTTLVNWIMNPVPSNIQYSTGGNTNSRYVVISSAEYPTMYLTRERGIGMTLNYVLPSFIETGNLSVVNTINEYSVWRIDFASGGPGNDYVVIMSTGRNYTNTGIVITPNDKVLASMSTNPSRISLTW